MKHDNNKPKKIKEKNAATSLFITALVSFSVGFAIIYALIAVFKNQILDFII